MKPPVKTSSSARKPPPAKLGNKAAAYVRAARRSLCPINMVLEAVGDSWSLLIIRDLMFRGHTGYQAFLRSEEGIATNILADRLLKLEQNGLINKTPDAKDARKFIYSLTEKGAHLAPLLVEMTLYSARFETRVDMPKEVMADIQKNKLAFASRMVRHNTPRPKGKRPPREVEQVEETLSLF